MQLAVEADPTERFTLGAFTPQNRVFEFAIRSHGRTRFRKRLVRALKTRPINARVAAPARFGGTLLALRRPTFGPCATFR